MDEHREERVWMLLGELAIIAATLSRLGYDTEKLHAAIDLALEMRDVLPEKSRG